MFLLPTFLSFLLLFFLGSVSIGSAAEVRKNKPEAIPVLMYHSISNGRNSLCISPGEFEQHIKSLLVENFTPITANELYTAWQTGRKLPSHPVLITLDDGYADNYNMAFPLIERYGVKATIFMITAKINAPNYLSLEQMQLMENSGRVDIESHSINHPDLRKLSTKMLHKELEGSKRVLENKLKKEVKIFCYPAGKYDKTIVNEVNRAGYGLAFTTHNGLADLEQGSLTLKRVRVNPHMAFHKLLHTFKQNR